MDRRLFFTALAVLTVGSFTAAPAEARMAVFSPGATGVKKNATVRVRNTTNRAYYVLVGDDEQLRDLSGKFGIRGTVDWSKKLGAILVPASYTGVFPVPAGTGRIVIYLPAEVPKSGNLPVAQAALEYGVFKKETITARILPGPVLEF